MAPAQPPPDSPNSEKAEEGQLADLVFGSYPSEGPGVDFHLDNLHSQSNGFNRGQAPAAQVPSPRVYSAYANLAKEYHRYDPDIELSNSSEFGGSSADVNAFAQTGDVQSPSSSLWANWTLWGRQTDPHCEIQYFEMEPELFPPGDPVPAPGFYKDAGSSLKKPPG
ncbi:hypothetical protein AK812_SmicGene32058 [Symbiodinium microadriaticum]|uniref:Uncharacterized protein n=1 Tax=Symbiodinium microadriaticum TaxID=2951 RepID=A0A1Q9CV69_SYMMI|nr:hypothetical protein AK812_SmicGene32058 [Symbiodinium microadriaticum]